MQKKFMESTAIIKVNEKQIFKALTLFLILLFSLNVFAQPAKLSLVDIFTALRSNKATLQQKNQILTEGVKQRGVTFILSESLKAELEKAGAAKNLIEAIQQQNPVPIKAAKVEPTPVAKPTPKPKDFAYYQNRGNSSYVLGDYGSAIKHYTEAIKLNEKEANIFLSRGLAFYNKKNYSSATEDFTKVIELTPEESMAYYNRGNALKELGKFEEAFVDYKKATELDTENELAKNAFEQLQTDLKPKQDDKKTDGTTSGTKTNEKTLKKVPVNIASLQTLAIKLISPVYPSFERGLGIEGVVTVKVIIDEKGKVISAKAISGPTGLRKSSEYAARRSKFRPYLVDNVPQSASGFIKYNFKK